MKHYSSKSRRRRYHNNNTTNPIIQPQKRDTSIPQSPLATPSARDDYETFSSPVSSPTLVTRTLNRIRLVIGTLFLIPALLFIAPAELLVFDDFLFYFRKGLLPSR